MASKHSINKPTKQELYFRREVKIAVNFFTTGMGRKLPFTETNLRKHFVGYISETAIRRIISTYNL